MFKFSTISINVTITNIENPVAYQLGSMTILLQVHPIDGYRVAVITAIAARNITE